MRVTFLLLILALVSLAEPNVFRFVLRQVISFEAWRSGVSVYIGRIQGSLFEPIALINSHWTYRSDTGATTRLEIARTDAQFAWRDFFKQGGDRWFRRLSVRGVTGKIVLPHEPQKRRERAWTEQLRPRGRWLATPARIEAREVDFVFQSGQDYVRLEQTRFLASELEPGILRAGRITVRQRGLDRTFREVRGTTALKESKLLIANLALEPGVEVSNLSAEFADLARGELNVGVTLAAFGGTVRVKAQTSPRERLLTFDATGVFEQIQIAPLAAFLGLSEAAGGTIKEGRFSFRGAPQDIVRADASLWLNASNFQWESRQWDSLTFGARLMDRRVEILELELRQGQNRLSLAGELGLRTPGAKWWQQDVTCEIAAKIENLTDLSALLMPEFKFAGKANIDGSIRLRNEQLYGQLIVSGSALKWRDAPIENLHAAIKLQGNECQVSNFELFNAGDYVRGRGVVNIRGPTQYWGEFHASIDELGSYAALLQPPIVPEPLAGGAVVDWSGEGSAKGHSGQLLARLKKIRSLGTHASQLHPINADLEAHYAPGTVHFSRFSLSDDDSSFTAAVAIGPKTFSVQNIRLMHQQQLWLEGSALLPLDVWNAWPNTSLLTLLNDATVSRVKLSAYDLELGAASQLLGWKFPVGGKVRGNISVDGPIGSLNMNGKVSLAGGRLPLGGKAGTLTEVETAATLRGSTIALEQLTARHCNGYLRLSGTVGMTNVRDPLLQLALESRHMGFRFFQGLGLPTRASRFSSGAKAIDVGAALDLSIEGPLSAASVQGRARISDLFAGSSPLDLTPLWQENTSPSLPPALIFAPGPWKTWRLDVQCRTEPSVALLPGTVTADLRLTGTGASPALAGTIHVAGVPASGGDNPLMIQDATLSFHEDRPEKPTLDLHASGSAFDCPFMAFATGPLSHLMRWFIFEPPLTERLVRRALTESETGHLQNGARFSLLAPAVFSDNVQTYDWSTIEIPAPAEKNDSSTVEIETTTASARFP